MSLESRVSGLETRDPRHETRDATWRPLTRLAGLAALAAGIVFRRFLSIEVDMVTPNGPAPVAVGDRLDLLLTQPFLGLIYLDVFDLVNYALVALMLLGLYVALRRTHPAAMLIATATGLVGVSVYFSTNASLSMLALSRQLGVGASQTDWELALAAGQALLAQHRFGLGIAGPGTGGYVSLLLVAAAGMIGSITMLRDQRFGRAPGIAGILANGLDLLYCLLYAILPAEHAENLVLALIPPAGLGYMVWHILVGLRLLRLARLSGDPG